MFLVSVLSDTALHVKFFSSATETTRRHMDHTYRHSPSASPDHVESKVDDFSSAGEAEQAPVGAAPEGPGLVTPITGPQHHHRSHPNNSQIGK